MYRVAIVPLSLGGADLRLAHKAEREAARAWNTVVTWGKAELAAGRWPNAYDLKRRLLALPAGERPELHTHSLQEICFDYEAACKTTKANKDAGRRARYPHRPKAFRPASFSRNFAWSVKHAATGDRLKLSFGKSRAYVALPEVGGGPQTWGEVLLCWNGKGFELHVAYQVPEPVAPGAGPLPLAGAIDQASSTPWPVWPSGPTVAWAPWSSPGARPGRSSASATRPLASWPGSRPAATGDPGAGASCNGPRPAPRARPGGACAT